MASINLLIATFDHDHCKICLLLLFTSHASSLRLYDLILKLLFRRHACIHSLWFLLFFYVFFYSLYLYLCICRSFQIFYSISNINAGKIMFKYPTILIPFLLLLILHHHHLLFHSYKVYGYQFDDQRIFTEIFNLWFMSGLCCKMWWFVYQCICIF